MILNFLSENLTKDWHIKIILGIFAFAVSIFIAGCSFSGEQQSVSIDTETKVEISMEEAIEIGQLTADQYYKNMKLTEIHSYDNDYERNENSGENGKREWWYVDFANSESNYVSVLIQNGQAVYVFTQDENWNSGLIDLGNIKMTSEEAVQKAQALGMRGGNPANDEEWVSGYNFKLSYSSLIDSPDNIRIFLEVIGISPNGNFAHIDFDAETAEILLKEEKIIYEDGSEKWIEF